VTPIIAVCPPDAARELAAAVLAAAPAGWSGWYLDANAIAPSTFAEITAMGRGAKCASWTAGFIGPPAHP